MIASARLRRHGRRDLCAGRPQKMDGWLRWRWVQFLGMVSYSLYLIHNPVMGPDQRRLPGAAAQRQRRAGRASRRARFRAGDRFCVLVADRAH